MSQVLPSIESCNALSESERTLSPVRASRPTLFEIPRTMPTHMFKTMSDSRLAFVNMSGPILDISRQMGKSTLAFHGSVQESSSPGKPDKSTEDYASEDQMMGVTLEKRQTTKSAFLKLDLTKNQRSGVSDTSANFSQAAEPYQFHDNIRLISSLPKICSPPRRLRTTEVFNRKVMLRRHPQLNIQKPEFVRLPSKLPEKGVSTIEDTSSSHSIHHSVYSLSKPLSQRIQGVKKKQVNLNNKMYKQTTLELNKDLLATDARVGGEIPSMSEGLHQTNQITELMIHDPDRIVPAWSPIAQDKTMLSDLMTRDLSGGKQLKFRFDEYREQVRRQGGRSLSVHHKVSSRSPLKSCLVNRTNPLKDGDSSVVNGFGRMANTAQQIKTMTELGQDHTTPRKKKQVEFSKNKMVLIFNPNS